MLDFIKENLNWVVAGIGGIFGLGVAKAKLVVKRELYNEDGSCVYIRKDVFCDVIAEVKETMKDQSETLSEFNHTLGRIEQFIENNKR
jgi:hypothetical protein